MWDMDCSLAVLQTILMRLLVTKRELLVDITIAMRGWLSSRDSPSAMYSHRTSASHAVATRFWPAHQVQIGIVCYVRGLEICLGVLNCSQSKNLRGAGMRL